jgi:pyruvate dehydrogenase E2 component (dihydrolipoamide acetyltransferase)
MPKNVVMERYGWLTKEGKILEWFKKEGDQVEKDEKLLELETEKVVIEVKAPSSGTLLKVVASAGAVVPVGGLIAVIGEPGEPIPETRAAKEPPQILATEKTSVRVGRYVKEKAKSSPVARRLAKEHKINLSEIKGTGPDGRIVRDDVIKAIKASDREQVEQPEVAANARKQAVRVIPLEGSRKTIADRMKLSSQNTAHVTTITEIDVSELVKFRKNVIPEVEREADVRLTYTDVIIKAVAKALEEHSIVNSVLLGNEIYVMGNINIGIAVSLEEGLVVPVICNANMKSLVEIALMRKKIVEMAREGKVEEFKRGTFTVTNIGMYGMDIQTPIINPPQSAILGIGRIVDKPVVVDGRIVVRSMMYLSLTFDHRVFDGVPAARFLQTLEKILGDPYKIVDAQISSLDEPT